ncbi:MAG: PVC-type heme-binding CxxCH protein [Planctomycetota bacterium]
MTARAQADRPWIGSLVTLAGTLAVVLSVAAEDPAGDGDYGADLPRIPQVPLAAARDTLRVAAGFDVELMAAEPLVASPVAIAWDEDGRLFVAEMRGYSEDQDQRLGRIRLLVDDDGDGKPDRATVYADGLAWPTALVCHDGGLFVGDAPDILRLEDADGDGVAEKRRVVFTGFGTGNVQGLFNSFHFGPDNRIHGAGSSSGGDVARLDADGAPWGAPIAIRGRDFSFDPRSLDLRPETGGAQHGMSFDDGGGKYLCHNSDHCIRAMIADRFLSRNPVFATGSARESVAVEGPQAAVYRQSPVEPWRVLRTRLRASGIVPGIVEGGGRPAGYFTSATGITAVRGDAVGDLAGMVVVGDVGSNLVHRKRVMPRGAGVQTARVDADAELVAATDIWFRPVQFANAPDGGLWIIDMQREVIEHPASLAPPIKKHLDLTSGRDSGRLWRLAAAGAPRRPAPRLSQATIAELVALLGHPNGWHRDTARRLLVTRGDMAAVEPLRRLLADRGADERARQGAAVTLAGLGALSGDDVGRCLDDASPLVRGEGVRLVEHLDAAGRAALAPRLVALAAREEAIAVRLELALAAGGLGDDERLAILTELLARDGHDPWCRMAAFTSAGGLAGRIVTTWLAAAAPPSAAARAALPGLVAQIGKSRDAAALADAVGLLEQRTRTAGASQTVGRDTVSKDTVDMDGVDLDGVDMETAGLVVDLAAAVAAAGGRLADVEPVATTAALVGRVVATGRQRVADSRASPAHRAAGVPLVALAGSAELAPLLEHGQPEEIVAAAVAALDRSRDPAATEILAAALPALPARSRPAALAALATSPAGARRLLDAIAAGAVSAESLERAQAAALWTAADEVVRTRAAEVLGPPPAADRGALVAAYRASLPPAGDPTAGRAIFTKHCVACHRVEGQGRELGPNLAAMQARGPDAILLGILDPNREVLPAYLAHAAVTADGRGVTGVIAAESDGALTLRTADGTDVVLPRDEIESLVNTRRSLMPEGFERSIDARGMADVLAYLMQAK